MDVENKQLIMDGKKFKFYESYPKLISNNIVKSEDKLNYAKSVNNVKILPNSFEIVKLHIPKSFADSKQVNLIPVKTKLNYLISESVNNIIDKKYIFTIVENNSDRVITLRKMLKVGTLQIFDNSDIMEPNNSEILQVNTLNLREIHKLRKDYLNVDDFDLKHLNDNDKS